MIEFPLSDEKMKERRIGPHHLIGLALKKSTKGDK